MVNYATLLEENKYFEESFKVHPPSAIYHINPTKKIQAYAYERGLDLFTYPVAFELWNLYLTKAANRQIDIQRLGELFEQAVENCPPKFAKVLYLIYGDLEEEHGLPLNAIRIYERAPRAGAKEERFEMFDFYVMKSASNFGLSSTRPI